MESCRWPPSRDTSQETVAQRADPSSDGSGLIVDIERVTRRTAVRRLSIRGPIPYAVEPPQAGHVDMMTSRTCRSALPGAGDECLGWFGLPRAAKAARPVRPGAS